MPLDKRHAVTWSLKSSCTEVDWSQRFGGCTDCDSKPPPPPPPPSPAAAPVSADVPGIQR